MVERFVLNRIEPNERKTLEAHLAVCGACRLAIRSEQEFVAGVRRFGRDELKARLKQRIGETKSRQLSWAQVISVAAAIV
ncbi:MAG: zf-HC2 domain-containing protein, partial [Ignavibacteriales bacterium]|nr:zf-HC2 domain-containing protein [Ignavibacteriales bacterium]